MCAWASLLAYGGAGHVGQETRDVSRVCTSLRVAHRFSNEARKYFMLAFLDCLNFGGEGAHNFLAERPEFVVMHAVQIVLMHMFADS